MKITYRKIILLFLLSVVMLFGSAQAQTEDDPWPPFFFAITPSYENGLIEYRMRFSSLVDWRIEDLTWRITIPEGTRFVEGDVQSTTTLQPLDDQVIFFTSVFHRPIRHAIIVLEVTDPEKTIFSSDVTVDWKGTYPGTYQMRRIDIDTTKADLEWSKPRYALNLGLTAEVNPTEDTITYSLYPDNLNRFLRMWDLRINLPIPEGAGYLYAETPPQYSVDYDGEEVYFKVAELPNDQDFGPIRVHVSTEGVPDEQHLSTYAWVAWKNSGFSVGRFVNVEESYSTGEVVVQPRQAQIAIADILDDAAVPNYDVTSLTLSDNGSNLQVLYRTAGPIVVGDPLTFMMFFDTDCRADTGQWRDSRGAEYRVRYTHWRNGADIMQWDETAEEWNRDTQLDIPFDISGNQLIFSVPYSLLNQTGDALCWTSTNRSDTDQFNAPWLPADKVPNEPDFRFTEYQPSLDSQLALQLDRVLTQQDLQVVSSQLNNPNPAPAEPTPTAPPQAAAPIQPTAAATPEPAEPIQPIEDRFVLVGDTWQYQPGWEAPPSQWSSLPFDDAAWYSGRTEIGYGDGDFQTDLSATVDFSRSGDGSSTSQTGDSANSFVINNLLPSDFTSLFMRREFTLPQPETVSDLTLTIDYEDGFIAYLNGEEVVRRGLRAPGLPVMFDTPAIDRESGTPEVIDLSDAIGTLNDGENVLAIQVHRSFNRSGLFISPELTWTRTGSQPSAASPSASTAATDAATDEAQPPPQTEDALANVADSTTETATDTTTNQPPQAEPLSEMEALQAALSNINLDTVPRSAVAATIVNPEPTAVAEVVAAPAPPPAPLELTTSPTPQPIPQIDAPSPNPNPSIIDTQGKIAIPVDNGSGLYNVHVYTVRFGYGWETHFVPNARQPDLSPDGLRMLVNVEGAPEDNVSEYSFIDGSLRRVSDNPLDSHPTYDPGGNLVVYDNPALIVDAAGVERSHIIVQCDLTPPHLQLDRLCRDVNSLRVLVASAHIGAIEGENPVWAANDMIVYRGCNTWLNGASCGIYTVTSGSIKAISDGFTPMQLTTNTSDIPTDTRGNHVVFMSEREGNWEAYVMGLNGSNVRNLSNSPTTNDGLPAISPDGNWVAFVSDRDGQWAVWAIPIVGGTPQKLFDFPAQFPWGSHERSWTNERISWEW